MDNKLQDRLVGSLIGLAIGDAVGASVEFKKRGTFPLVTDMNGGGPFRLPVGFWTDDTSMALCLADSLLEKSGLDKNDLLSKFVNWYLHGYNSSTGKCFDIGNTTINALENYSFSGTIENNTENYWQGNGSLMRMAPIVIYYHEDPDLAVTMSAEQCKTTHASLPVVHCCELLAGILLRAYTAGSKAEALAVEPLAHWHPAVVDMTKPELLLRTREEIRSSGHCIDTLEAAIWCFNQTDDFNSAILLATNLGDDTDTVAAVTGQIAGAYYGLDGIRPDWVQKLYDHDRIINLAIQLAKKE